MNICNEWKNSFIHSFTQITLPPQKPTNAMLIKSMFWCSTYNINMFIIQKCYETISMALSMYWCHFPEVLCSVINWLIDVCSAKCGINVIITNISIHNETHERALQLQRRTCASVVELYWGDSAFSPGNPSEAVHEVFPFSTPCWSGYCLARMDWWNPSNSPKSADPKFR